MSTSCSNCGAPLAGQFCTSCGQGAAPPGQAQGAFAQPQQQPWPGAQGQGPQQPYGGAPQQPYGGAPQQPYGGPQGQMPYGGAPQGQGYPQQGQQPWGGQQNGWPQQGQGQWPQQGGYPQHQAQSGSSMTEWKWGYSRWMGIHYGPIPVGIIVAVIVIIIANLQ